ncbi:MAG TPA: hypothetical protein VJ385_00050 [Fibrobacteria bacterium]|nr:hypothetical protein [Fibrobacteria bacterium]
MNIRTLLVAALLVASSLFAQSFSMRAGMTSSSGRTYSYYEYPVSNGILTYSSEMVPTSLPAVGYQIRILSNHNLINGKMLKPIIVPEGFDVDHGTGDQVTFENMQDLLSRVADVNTLGNTSVTPLIKTLYDEGFEIVILKFKDCTRAVNDNSWAIQSATLKVASWLESPVLPIKFVGPSMGGLVQRHALQTFHSRFSGTKPNVSTYISFDSPQRGALVPMSVQAFLLYVYRLDDDSKIKLANLTSPAAQQMLLYYQKQTVMPDGNQTFTLNVGDYEGASTPHGIFMRTMDQGVSELYNYSRNSWTAGDISRVSILNGSGDAATQGLPQNTEIMTMYADAFSVDQAKVHLYSHGGGRTAIFSGWRKGMGINDYSLTQNLTGDCCFVENAPGGARKSYTDAGKGWLDTDPDGATTGMSMWNAAFGPDPRNSTTPVGGKPLGHSFVPTISGLGLNPALEGTNVNTTNFWFRNARAVANAANYRDVSIFNKAYLPAKNQPHMYITTENINWFLNELRATPCIAQSPVNLPLL